MIKYVFVLLLIMPDGQTKMKTDLVETCPDKPSIDAIFNEMKDHGDILDWGASCLQFTMTGLSDT